MTLSWDLNFGFDHVLVGVSLPMQACPYIDTERNHNLPRICKLHNHDVFNYILETLKNVNIIILILFDNII